MENPNFIGEGEDRYKDLRYPYAPIHETTDYLRINIVKYTASTKINPGEIIGNTRVGTIQNQINYIGPDGNPVSLSDTPGNRKFARNQQAQMGVLKVSDPSISFSGRKNIKNQGATIILPIPSNIQDGNSVKYTEGSLDGLTANILGIALSTMRTEKDIGTAISTLLKSGTNALLDPASKEYYIRNLASSAANLPFGGNLTASQLLARETGNILNPNMELLFDGVTLRSFKFSFKLTPRNKTEAEKVKNIIRLLKINMAPGASDTGFGGQSSIVPGGSMGMYLSTPHIFELAYMKGGSPHPFLHKFKQCFLTDMSVNYTGEGTYATYGGSNDQGGGTPVSMVMDLGFKELEPIYAGDYSGTEGVGY